MNDHGMVTVASRYSVAKTIDRVAQVVVEKGLTVFARIDHTGNARAVGLDLRPTELIIFGNPRAGTPLMQHSQTAGLDLPFRALSWQDPNGKVWLTCNDPKWLAARHGIDPKHQAISAIDAGISMVCRYATGESG